MGGRSTARGNGSARGTGPASTRTTSRPRPTAAGSSSSARAARRGTRRSRWRSLEVLDAGPRDRRRRARWAASNFDASDDPERLTVSASSRYAAVLLAKSRRTVAVDVSDPDVAPADRPHAGRRRPGAAMSPQSEDSDWIMMPAGSDGDTIALECPELARRRRGRAPARRTPITWSRPARSESALEILQTKPQHEVGRFPLLRAVQPGTHPADRPGLLARAELIAVATRTGSIHVVEMLRHAMTSPVGQTTPPGLRNVWRGRVSSARYPARPDRDEPQMNSDRHDQRCPAVLPGLRPGRRSVGRAIALRSLRRDAGDPGLLPDLRVAAATCGSAQPVPSTT